MPDAKRRTCCNSHLGYPHQPDCPRRGGRPVTTGETRTRSAGRHPDALWDACVAQATADGQDMTAFIRDAITRELNRRRSAAAVAAMERLPLTTVNPIPVDPNPEHVGVFTRDDGTTFEARPAVGGYVYATPGARHCRCTFLGEGTPEHDVSPMCESLMPDADRDPAPGSWGPPPPAVAQPDTRTDPT